MEVLRLDNDTNLFFFEDTENRGRFKFVKSDFNSSFELNLRLNDEEAKKVVAFITGILDNK